MLAIAASMDGRDIKQSASLRYILHHWRRKFKASYQDMLDTPLEVILTDIEYIQIEDKIIRDKRTNGQPHK